VRRLAARSRIWLVSTDTSAATKTRSNAIWIATRPRASWPVACTSPKPTVARVDNVKYRASVLVVSDANWALSLCWRAK
jgi:hypothetical protein